ncbi:unnamed protein product [Arabidopsis thaliana]|uniref:Filament-like protein (DUF869) n=4 Tax=Arabidopsis TaxID=3701 RepID=Q9ZQ21_ARATH|nr:filament-like protein (DUF869) [Arabidopsis thaliana]KAG7637287.1 Filament-like plant protein [Arabidopsis thaliana x Arabidopsis arenosa]KAG7641904.1 Filament-like plant protein [Arabidopsis suecica]AAD18118.1 hypothetical protein [Arabidopsis thaliana]AEC07581.1 filament-like protein (DUF869) [Arabidopsis thaliana]VYS53369.1 unnamed protein product [Arabidopsis thaliana]|eukprot:NP_180023.1 filament-like protein (DUF869) [Arabidopsis thaliana]
MEEQVLGQSHDCETAADKSDQKLQDVTLAKTTHWGKIKAMLEEKIDELSQGLHRVASDNAALTRSLQERSEMIVKISEERSKAEADVEKLKD